jgi:hypothetical protein
MVFLNTFFQDPIAFWTVQSAWQRDTSGPIAALWPVIVRGVTQSYASGDIWWNAMLDVTAFFAFLGIAWVVYRRLGESYALYMILGLLIPAWSGSGSLSRYVLVLFPAFMMLGYWGRRQNLHQALVVLFCVLLGILTTAFVNWVFVA